MQAEKNQEEATNLFFIISFLPKMVKEVNKDP